MAQIPDHPDVESVSRIAAVPTILEVVCRTTGMRFAAVARVTEDRWIACSVLDEIDFGLKPGGELRVDTTICNEIRQSGEAVIIDDVDADPGWCAHPTPLMYGFKSYISVPIILSDNSIFGTLCAIDPRPVRLRTPETIGMFRLFAELIAKHLDASRKLASTEESLRGAQRSNEMLQRFAFIAAHDLSQPLRQVAIFSTLLARHYADNVDPKAREYFDHIEVGTARMRRLIEGLLAYSSIESAQSSQVQTADTSDALDEALRGLALLVRETGAIVTRDTLPKVSGNPSQLAQVFQNLISNAIKYRSAAAPRIHVEAERTGDAWVISVSDNGRGIAPEHREKIFGMFTRLHGSEIEGAGLGLAFCSKIVELHEGRIWMEPNPAASGGSIFRFTVPALKS